VIRLVTDSNSQLPPSLRDKYSVDVVPLTVTVDGVTMLEGEQIDLAGITAALERQAAVGSSTPSPGQFLEAYERAVADGATAVLSVHAGGQASGTANSARLAAGMASIPVEVVDTGTLSLAARGGRLAAGVETTDVPVLALTAGKMQSVGRVADVETAVAAMVEQVVKQAQGQRIRLGVGHLAATELADQLEAALRERVQVEQLIRYSMGPSVAVHVGLGTVGCVFYPV
jgi:fatty acid-binding protein DegV